MLRERLVRWVRSAWRLFRDPEKWSADRYRAKNEMDFAAVRPETWREPEPKGS